MKPINVVPWQIAHYHAWWNGGFITTVSSPRSRSKSASLGRAGLSPRTDRPVYVDIELDRETVKCELYFGK